MTLDEIKSAVLAGKTVQWISSNYVVKYHDKSKQFSIVCLSNNHSIGLTWRDGVTINGKPEQFFISDTN